MITKQNKKNEKMEKNLSFHLIYPHESRNTIARLEVIYRATHL